MSTFLQRPPAFTAASPPLESPRESISTSVKDSRSLGAPARVELPRPSLRPIDLERRARFARIEAQAPRGA